MKTKIPYYKLTEFTKLHDEIAAKFGSQLYDTNSNIRLTARSNALAFIRDSGFNIDDKLEWVTWHDPKDYVVSVLRWA